MWELEIDNGADQHHRSEAFGGYMHTGAVKCKWPVERIPINPYEGGASWDAIWDFEIPSE
jgi:hypothetical protein